jgi:hypothetical protein
MLILGKNIDQSDSSVSEEEEEELEGEETEELDRVIEQPSKSLPKSVDKNIEESYPIYHDYMSSIEESELESRFKKFLEKHQGSSSSAATASASATTPPTEESSSSSKKALKKNVRFRLPLRLRHPALVRFLRKSKRLKIPTM